MIEYDWGPWQGGVGTVEDYAPSPARAVDPTTAHYLSGAVRTRADFDGTNHFEGPVLPQGQADRHSRIIVRYHFSTSAVESYSFSVCTGYVAAPGLPYYEPLTEMRADPKAIGWQFPDSPIYLDRTACINNGVKALYDEWTTWDDTAQTDGYWTYWMWTQLNFRPMLSGHLNVTVTSSYAGSGVGQSLVIGAPAHFGVSTGSSTEYIYMTSAYTAEVIGGTSHATVDGNFTIPMPPLTDVPGYGNCIVPAISLTDIRGALTLPAPGPAPSGDRSAVAYVDAAPMAVATRNLWRLLYPYTGPKPDLSGKRLRKLVRFS